MPYRKSHRCPDGKTCSFCAPYAKRQRLQQDAKVAEAMSETGVKVGRRAMPGSTNGAPGTRDRSEYDDDVRDRDYYKRFGFSE